MRILAVIAVVWAALCALVLAWPMSMQRFLSPQESGVVLDRNGNVLYAFLNVEDAWCFPRDLSAISPRLVQAVIATEDQRHRSHIGVDPIAIGRAAAQNIRRGAIVSGASTITMQVVKQTAGRERTTWGKLRQAIQAIRLERRVDKQAILASYLNGAPYGGNLIGCEAAARRYFGKPAAELTLPEAALLAGLPKAPTSLMPLTHPDAALARRNHVLARMRDEGYITSDECTNAQTAPLNASWHDFPELAPHLAYRLRPATGTGIVTTTLDAAVQTLAERGAREHVAKHDGRITNAAVIVVDVPNATVLARVGSVDFHDTPGGGQVDACRAARSPGSALKPFAYALAMESNQIFPTEALLDNVLDYGTYQPVNFDGRMHGLVSADDALRRSLNIPAVMVLERIGCPAFYTLLRETGLTTLTQPPEFYGLGLVLGNCEVKLEEVAAAYCMLANLGEYRPLAVRADEVRTTRRVLSPGTCLSIYSMLEQPLPDEFDARMVMPNASAPVCWKTGTSTGLRDAWAYVFNAQYLVAVWMGNNDGASARSLIGAQTALPLAAQVFRSLPPAAGPAWPDAKDELRTIDVCSVTGLPATLHCPTTRRVRVPRTLYLTRVCGVHFPARHDEASVDTRIVERWPATARNWDLARVAAPVAPESSRPHDGEVISAALAHGESLQITDPADGAHYILTGEANGDRIRLATSVDTQATVHWYTNRHYLGASSPDTPLFLELTAGTHAITCMTDDGHHRSVTYTVTRPKASGYIK